MARIRSKDTQPEVATRAAVYALGERYRKHVSDLPGKPDLANKSKRWSFNVFAEVRLNDIAGLWPFATGVLPG
jgi:G:T-mismatch repair DNA endonuclease (very short patch repair protein)